MNRFRGLATIVAAALLGLLAGCAETTTVNARHDPLYRAEVHASTITAQARNERDGIRQMEIEVIEGEMYACGSWYIRLIPCRSGATKETHFCVFTSPLPKDASCSFRRNLKDRRLVTYRARAISGGQQAAETAPITYSGGAALDVAFVGVGPSREAIPWEVARPIWWHSGLPGGLANRDHLDIGFFPDSDWPTYRAFTDALQPLILEAHFNIQRRFSQLFTIKRDDVFDLWAGPPGADATGVTRTMAFGGLAANVAGETEGDVIVHKDEFRDFASLSFNGAGTVFAFPNPDFPWVSSWTYTHESGHFLFGLGDEYVGGGNVSISDPPNVFGSFADCQLVLADLSHGTCTEIFGSNRWYIAGTGLQIMRDNHERAEWATASGRVVGRRFTRCGQGIC